MVLHEYAKSLLVNGESFDKYLCLLNNKDWTENPEVECPSQMKFSDNSVLMYKKKLDNSISQTISDEHYTEFNQVMLLDEENNILASKNIPLLVKPVGTEIKLDLDWGF